MVRLCQLKIDLYSIRLRSSASLGCYTMGVLQFTPSKIWLQCRVSGIDPKYQLKCFEMKQKYQPPRRTSANFSLGHFGMTFFYWQNLNIWLSFSGSNPTGIHGQGFLNSATKCLNYGHMRKLDDNIFSKLFDKKVLQNFFFGNQCRNEM